MKSYPTLVQFNEGRHSMFPPAFTHSDKHFKDTATFARDENSRALSSHPNAMASYSTMFEEYNKLVQTILMQHTTRLTPTSKKDRVNQYQVEEKLGKGRFAVVFKARLTKEGGNSRNGGSEVVALKCMTKKPVTSLFSMNQILKQRARWKSTPGMISPTGTIAETPYLNENIALRSSAISLSSTGVVDSDRLIIEMNLLRIRKECLIHSQLYSHPNINELLEILDSPKSDRIWMVLEYSSLGELRWERDSRLHVLDQWRQFLHSNTASRFDFALKTFRDVCSGLAFLQDQGIIHRDIKPSNILLDDVSGMAKISDFGCSIIKPNHLPWWGHERENLKWTKAFKDEITKIVGTPAFIPPELCDFTIEEEMEELVNENLRTSRRGTVLDTVNAFKIDVWSLGVSLFCILENRLPFLGDNEFDTYHMVVNEYPPLHYDSFNSEERRGSWLYEFLVRQLLCKDISKRPYAREALEELDRLERNNQSKIGKVKKRLIGWKNKLRRNNYPKQLTSTPSDLMTRTIFSHSSSSTASSMFTMGSSIDFID